jgi:hypothetical protein
MPKPIPLFLISNLVVGAIVAIPSTANGRLP